MAAAVAADSGSPTASALPLLSRNSRPGCTGGSSPAQAKSPAGGAACSARLSASARMTVWPSSSCIADAICHISTFHAPCCADDAARSRHQRRRQEIDRRRSPGWSCDRRTATAGGLRALLASPRVFAGQSCAARRLRAQATAASATPAGKQPPVRGKMHHKYASPCTRPVRGTLERQQSSSDHKSRSPKVCSAAASAPGRLFTAWIVEMALESCRRPHAAIMLPLHHAAALPAAATCCRMLLREAAGAGKGEAGHSNALDAGRCCGEGGGAMAMGCCCCHCLAAAAAAAAAAIRPQPPSRSLRGLPATTAIRNFMVACSCEGL